MKTLLGHAAFLSVAFLLAGCNGPLGNSSNVSTLLKSADSSTIEMRYAKTGSDNRYVRCLQYGQPETQQIVSALLGAHRDRGVYDTPVTLHTVKLYAKSKLLAEVGTCSSLFLFRGKQYRDQTECLSKLVDTPLDAAKEVEERTPAPVASPDKK